MGLSATWNNLLEIFAFRPVKTILGMNPMVLSSPRSNALGIIDLQRVK